MKRILIVLFIIISSPPLLATPQSKDKIFIDEYVNKKSNELRAGESYSEHMFGDLNNDNINDLAILYTLVGKKGLGGNSISGYLAVFKRTDKGLKLCDEKQVFNGVSRVLSFESIEKGVITFKSKFYLPTDPRCCPSGEGNAFYVLKRNNLLNEINAYKEQ